MDEMAGSEELSVELFSVVGAEGELINLMMTVPCGCGLKQADRLIVDGFRMTAMRNQTVVPLLLPALSEKSRSELIAWSKSGKTLVIGEFMASGLLDSYFVSVEVSQVTRFGLDK